MPLPTFSNQFFALLHCLNNEWYHIKNFYISLENHYSRKFFFEKLWWKVYHYYAFKIHWAAVICQIFQINFMLLKMMINHYYHLSGIQDFSFRGLREQKGVMPLFWSRPLFLAEKRSFPLFSGLYIGVHRTEKQRGINNLSE